MSPLTRPNSDICVAIVLLVSGAFAQACGRNDGDIAGDGGGTSGGGRGGSGVGGGAPTGVGGGSGPTGFGGSSGPAGRGGGGPLGGSGGPLVGGRGQVSGFGGGVAGVGGGPAGTGGRGGAGGAAGDNGIYPRVSSAGCAASFNALISPVLQDATLICHPPGTGLRVAAAPGARGYIAHSTSLNPPARIVTVESARISIEAGPPGVANPRIVVDPTGTVNLVAGGSPGVGVAFYAAQPSTWRREPVSPPPRPGAQTFALTGARFAPDGRAFVAYYSYDGTSHLATRAAAGGWTDALIPDMPSNPTLTVDSLQRPHVVYPRGSATTSAAGFSVYDWRPGVSSSPLWDPLMDPFGPSEAAPLTDGRVAASVKTKDGIHVVALDAGGTPWNVTLPNTQHLALTGCPMLPAVSGSEVPAMTCTETGEGTTAQVPAGTSDGRLWVAYVYRHIDRDVFQACPLFEMAYPCHRLITADRSVGEIVVVRVPTDGTAPATTDIRWRGPIAASADGSLAIDARGSQLTLAFGAAADAMVATIRYVVLETN